MLCNYIPQQRSDLLANIGEGMLRNWSAKTIGNWHILTCKPALTDPCEWVLVWAGIDSGRTEACLWKYQLIGRLFFKEAECLLCVPSGILCRPPLVQFWIHDSYLFIWWFHPLPGWRRGSRCCYSPLYPQLPAEECERNSYSVNIWLMNNEVISRIHEVPLRYTDCMYITWMAFLHSPVPSLSPGQTSLNLGSPASIKEFKLTGFWRRSKSWSWNHSANF